MIIEDPDQLGYFFAGEAAAGGGWAAHLWRGWWRGEVPATVAKPLTRACAGARSRRRGLTPSAGRTRGSLT